MHVRLGLAHFIIYLCFWQNNSKEDCFLSKPAIVTILESGLVHYIFKVANFAILPIKWYIILKLCFVKSKTFVTVVNW